MKKRLLIICSIIGVLLAGFQFPIYAEETPSDYSSSTSIVTNAALDQYFYDNYDLLPYIQSDKSQYINTGYNPSSNLLINLKFSDFDKTPDRWDTLFGAIVDDKQYYVGYRTNTSNFYFYYDQNTFYENVLSYYQIYDIKLDRNKIYFNNSLIHTFVENSFEINNNIYLFANNVNDHASNFSSFKLYRFSIYDYAANEGEGALVRDYYPARSKSGGIIGLYDAVSKTFVTTSGSVPFASPTGDSVNLSLGANITQFLSGSLSWIGAIFEGINEMPIIWVFIAIALAGVMFRWARRIVHF